MRAADTDGRVTMPNADLGRSGRLAAERSRWERTDGRRMNEARDLGGGGCGGLAVDGMAGATGAMAGACDGEGAAGGRVAGPAAVAADDDERCAKRPRRALRGGACRAVDEGSGSGAVEARAEELRNRLRKRRWRDGGVAGVAGVAGAAGAAGSRRGSMAPETWWWRWVRGGGGGGAGRGLRRRGDGERGDGEQGDTPGCCGWWMPWRRRTDEGRRREATQRADNGRRRRCEWPSRAVARAAAPCRTPFDSVRSAQAGAPVWGSQDLLLALPRARPRNELG